MALLSVTLPESSASPAGFLATVSAASSVPLPYAGRSSCAPRACARNESDRPVAERPEGKATLAIVHALEHGTAHEHAALRRVLEDLSFERTTHQEVLKILDRHGSVQYALDAAFQYAEFARTALAGLPESDYKRALLWMPDFVVARDK